MGKICKIIICGAPGVGKTSVLEKAIYGDFANTDQCRTKEDFYLAQIDTDRGVREHVRIQDTNGLHWLNPVSCPKQYFHYGDGFILVYSVTDKESFRCIEAVKREIEKTREKKDIVIAAVGNKSDLASQRQVEASVVERWAAKEKIKVFETSVVNRTGLLEPFIHVSSKLTQPPPKSTLLGSRRQKQSSIEHS